MKRLLVIALALGSVVCCSCGSDDKGTSKKEKAPKAEGPAKPRPVVVIKTSMGTIKAELFINKAPMTVENFLKYVDEKHYDGTVFHRVISDFMIQGGGFKKGLANVVSGEQVRAHEKPTGPPVRNEAITSGLSNLRGTLSMARTGEPHSATTQFFINVADNNGKVKYNLDPDPNRDPNGYAVFGKVIEGMDVVDKIKAVQTKELIPGFKDVPVTDVVIESIRRVEK